MADVIAPLSVIILRPELNERSENTLSVQASESLTISFVERAKDFVIVAFIGGSDVGGEFEGFCTTKKFPTTMCAVIPKVVHSFLS